MSHEFLNDGIIDGENRPVNAITRVLPSGINWTGATQLMLTVGVSTHPFVIYLM